MCGELTSKYKDGNIPEACQYVQAMLDRFVAVSYNATYHALHLHSNLNNLDYLREQIIPLLRDNPPFTTIPRYLRDGRPNYLWYSDFYDDAGKEVFRTYRRFTASLIDITPANYKEELNKIQLPYFAELVKFISLEKLYIEAEKRVMAAHEKVSDQDKPAEPDIVVESEQAQKEKPVKKRLSTKRSYEPKLNSEQYSTVVELIENIKLFSLRTTNSKLKLLLKGKLEEPLQVTNQNSLTYLFDQLAQRRLIKKHWMTVAVKNKDFLSFRRGANIERYGDQPHYITLQQLSNCRYNNEKTGSKDLITIDEAIEKIEELVVE